MPQKATDDDAGPRALLTEREREIVSGEADVSDSYRYQTISRVRQRFRQLDADMRALDAHGDLAAEVRAVICTDSIEKAFE
jgi:hypothetical protein